MTVTRMDNVGIVVEDLDAAIRFFAELGLTLEGRIAIAGEWAGRVTGVRGQRVEIAMMCTPDGYSRLELSRFDAPAIASDHRTAPVNSLGYLRVMFAVDDIDDTLARLRKLGATVVDEVVDYEDIYRLCYIRGPEGILIGLAQQLGQQTSREDPMERENGTSVPTADLAGAIEQSHAALGAILKGDASVYRALYSPEDDVTLGNPFGPYVRGRRKVEQTLAGAASYYRDGEVVDVELVSTYVSETLACVVEVERGRAKVGGAEEALPVAVRVTSVFRLESGSWKLVHRHADPITSPRPATSVIGK